MIILNSPTCQLPFLPFGPEALSSESLEETFRRGDFRDPQAALQMQALWSLHPSSVYLCPRMQRGTTAKPRPIVGPGGQVSCTPLLGRTGDGRERGPRAPFLAALRLALPSLGVHRPARGKLWRAG